MTSWKKLKRILCVRPDNLGDLLMSSPAIRSIKESFGCHVTVLTSPLASGIARYLSGVDDVIEWEAPWVKDMGNPNPDDLYNIVGRLRDGNFDGGILFTVFSQNPLPTALLMMYAGIPHRAAYCRENPYQLLTHWLPDHEPHQSIRHQVRRDLELTASVGATAQHENIDLILPDSIGSSLSEKLASTGLDLTRPWLIIHPGASEAKRQFDTKEWIAAGKRIINELGYQILLTGTTKEKRLTETLGEAIGIGALSIAGLLNLREFIELIRRAPLLITVNTGPAHIAAAVYTSVLVLYALTNPQHTPWKATGRILPFSIEKSLQSRNELLRYVHEEYYSGQQYVVKSEDIVVAARKILIEGERNGVDELVLPGIRVTGAT